MRRFLQRTAKWLLLALLASAGLTTAAHAGADLVLNHSDSPDPGPAGGVFTYTLRVDNNGPDAAINVALTDTLPAGASFVSVSSTAGSCLYLLGNVSCSLGDIPFANPTSFQTVTLQVILPTAGVWTNVATASSGTLDPNPGNNTLIAQPTTAVAAADMALTATPSASTVTAGQAFNYALVATNQGPDPLAADARQTIHFTVPSGAAVTAVPAGAGWSCAPSSGYPKTSGDITCNRTGALAAGASAPTLTVPAVTNNTGTVTAAFDVAAFKGDGSAMPDGNLANNTATADVSSNEGSDVSISKTASPTTVAQGADVTYTLTPRLNGGIAPGQTGPITVTDTLGAGLTFVSATGTGWTCDSSALPTISCTRPGPYAGGNYTNMPAITIVATASNAGTLPNTATISIPETDPVPGNNSASVNVTSSNGVDLRMTKTASFSPVVVGQDFTYSLTVRNLGPLAAQAGDTVSVTDTIPAGVTLTAQPSGGGWTCTPSSGFPLAGPVNVSCSRTLSGAFGVGAYLTVITVPVQQTATGPVANTAQVAYAGQAGRNDPNAANDSSTVTVTATDSTTSADLQVVSKTASPDPVIAGEDLTYVITVHNNGPADATNAVVSDSIGSLVGAGGLQSITPSQGSCTPVAPANTTGFTLNCNLGTLNNGATATVTVVVRPSIATTGSRTNTASVFSQDIGDPSRADNTRSVTSTVIAKVDVQVTKTANPASVLAGATVTYVTTVKNNGPSTAQTVSMTDTLPGNAAFIALVNVSGGGNCTTVPAAGAVGGTLTCSWASLASGAQQTVTYTMRPLGSAVGQNLVNNAAVTTSTLETNSANNSASTTTPVTAAQLDVLVNKNDSADPIDLGATTRYTITINNTGPSYGTNLVMTDVFPDPGSTPTATFSYQGNLSVGGGGSCVEPAVGATSGTLSCSFPGIASGQTITVAYDMKAEAITQMGAYSGTAFNKVSVRVDEPETLSTNNDEVEATTTHRTSIATDLGITKTTAATVFESGDTIAYTLTVTNNGPLASDGAQVVDVLPAGVSFVSAPGCVEGGGTVTCAVGLLAAGGAKSFTLTVQVANPYAGSNPLVNTATLDAPGDTNPANNSGAASVPRKQVIAPAPIPTLGQWGVILLAGLLVLTAAARLRRGS